MTYACCAKFGTNHIIKYVDDTAVAGLIQDDEDVAYREEEKQLVEWCNTNNLFLNVDKMKVIMLRNRPNHTPLYINSTTVELVKSIMDNLTWTLNT